MTKARGLRRSRKASSSLDHAHCTPNREFPDWYAEEAHIARRRDLYRVGVLALQRCEHFGVILSS